MTDTGHVTDTSYTSPSNLSWPLNLDNLSAANNVGAWTPDANVSIAGMKSPLAGFARFPPLVNSDSTRDGNFGGPTTCTECALYFCVNTYDISTRSGSTSSTLTSSWTNDTHRNRHDDVILNPPQDQRPHTLGVVQAPFFVAQPSQLSQYLTRQLRTTPCPPSDLLAQVSMAHDVTSMMADVATSVSAALMNKNRDVETGLGGSTTLQAGINWGMETIIIAHWEWLSLHVLLILLSIVFLWAVRSSTEHARSSLPAIWKSSLLGLVFSRVDCGNRDLRLYSDVRLGDMARMTKGLDVHLELDDGEWAFREKRV